MTFLATSPCLNTIRVGIERTSYCAVVCWFSSVLSLTTFRSSRSDWISSRTGATTRQGPHHGAQKSTSTGLSASSTSASKLLSVIWGRVPAIASPLRSCTPTIQNEGTLAGGADGPRLPAFALHGKHAREAGAHGDPARQIALRGDALGSDAEPAVHLAAAHLKAQCVRLCHARIGLIRVAAHQHAALTARGDRHVPADQERESAEHLLLDHAVLRGERLADAVGEILVVGHAQIIPARRHLSERSRSTLPTA